MAFTGFEMFKHRTYIYILFCKKKYLFSTETAELNSKYVKQLNLIPKNVLKDLKAFKNFFTKVLK